MMMMKSFKEYLSGVDPSNYRSPVEEEQENSEKKKWKQLVEEQNVTYGWSAFKYNEEDSSNYIRWITRKDVY